MLKEITMRAAAAALCLMCCAETQAAVRAGGRLVYCVCSLEPEEGEAQVEAFLARRKDVVLEPITAAEAPSAGFPEASLTPRGTLRLLPHHRDDGQDGFFAARFRKVTA